MLSETLAAWALGSPGHDISASGLEGIGSFRADSRFFVHSCTKVREFPRRGGEAAIAGFLRPATADGGACLGGGSAREGDGVRG